MSQMKAFCELDEKGKRVEVYFRYDPDLKDAVKAIPGARASFVNEKFKCWTIPKDLQCAKALRKIFGDGLELGNAVKAWANEERVKARNLESLAKSDEAELKVLPNEIPELNDFLRPFQRADVAFMAQANLLNANEPGLGKTVEVIASVFEGRLDMGPQLVVAPKTALETVWRYEIERWTDHFVFTMS